MAITFRYGPAGSYKTAAAVWFDLLPALEAGRIVYTNVEGMQPLDVIEERLGRKFPDSAQLVRISSRNAQGIDLWRNWYNWLPIGAFVLLDEVQDVFGTATGFKMVNYPRRPVEDFLPDLPPNHSELFNSRWQPVESLDPGEIDDTGRTQFDDLGRLLYPFDFNGACMRHRKYNWDLVLCTPDFKQIPSEVKGVAEVARQHRSKDSLALLKRRPRIFEHHPTTTVTNPTKQDLVYTLKVPLDVHLLYSSTGTGQVTKSGASASILKSPKFLFALFVAIAGFAAMVRMGYLLVFGDEEPAEAVASFTVAQERQAGSVVLEAAAQAAASDNGVSDRSASAAVVSPATGTAAHLDDFYPVEPYLHIYTTGYSEIRRPKIIERLVLFEIVTESGVYPLTSKDLRFFGVEVVQFSECVVQLRKGEMTRYIGCMPLNERYRPTPQPSVATINSVGPPDALSAIPVPAI